MSRATRLDLAAPGGACLRRSRGLNDVLFDRPELTTTPVAIRIENTFVLHRPCATTLATGTHQEYTPDNSDLATCCWSVLHTSCPNHTISTVSGGPFDQIHAWLEIHLPTSVRVASGTPHGMLLHANERAGPCTLAYPILQSSRLRPAFVRPSERTRIISHSLHAPHSPRL
jgi:hypothetical protein